MVRLLKCPLETQIDFCTQAGWDPHFTPRVKNLVWPNDNDRGLDQVTSLDPLFSFPSLTEYTGRHKIGTRKEFLLDKESIDKFNRRNIEFHARPIFYIRQMRDSAVLLFFVEPSDYDSMLPKEGESCDIFLNRFGKALATRVDNPCSLWHIRDDVWEKCLAFEIHLEEKAKIIKAFPKLTLPEPKVCIPPASELQRLQVSFKLRVSTSTMDAELSALRMLDEGRKEPSTGCSQWQIDAYKYFVDLRSPRRYMRLFRRFPHMKDPILKPDTTLPRLVELFETLNEEQRSAFVSLLGEIPHGICVVHGCPGAGKTHFNLVVAAALQLKDEITHPGVQVPTPWNNKVLYLIDINRPLNDTANKMARLYDELGLTKKSRIDGSTTPRVAIRMHCWSYEKTRASRNRLQAEWDELNHRVEEHRAKPESRQQGISAQQAGDVTAAAADNSDKGPLEKYYCKIDESQKLTVYRLAPSFRKAEHLSRTRAGQPDECIAPSLDDAAWAMYQRFKDTKYARLTTIRRHMNIVRSTDLGYLEDSELETLYRDTLHDADIVFTTPVSASKFSSSMFSPALVIFDEAPHARELSNLIAIAHFNPAAWIFSGDVRQTKPFVRSLGNNPCRNEYVEQLRVSMMARAYRKNPDGPSLNINHRARGDLQNLASTLFYRDRMIPAINPQRPGAIPPSTVHLRDRYIMPMKRNEGNQVSRLLVRLKDPGPVEQVDERSWWRPGHQRWIMDLVLKLLKDAGFRQTDGVGQGTILIMSPYKQAFIQYRKAIRELKARHQAFKDRTVEARTIDTAQGHEADAVILDFVRARPTSHTNDPNRLCVALTRARQAEFILMHKDMIQDLAQSSRHESLRNMVSICQRSGEYISDPAPLTDA